MSDPIRSGDPIAATGWLGDLGEEVRGLEGDDLTIYAQLTDVDEIAVVINWFDVEEQEMIVHLSRVQAIALAGQLAWAATASPAELPHGHGPDGFIAR